jgi:hypothetical protein
MGGLAIARDAEGRIGRACWPNLQAGGRRPIHLGRPAMMGLFYFLATNCGISRLRLISRTFLGLEQSLTHQERGLLFQLAHCRTG